MSYRTRINYRITTNYRTTTTTEPQINYRTLINYRIKSINFLDPTPITLTYYLEGFNAIYQKLHTKYISFLVNGNGKLFLSSVELIKNQQTSDEVRQLIVIR